MKKLALLFVLCTFSLLAFAQSDSDHDPASQQDAVQESQTGWATLSPSSWSLGTVPTRYAFYQGFTVSNGSTQNVGISNVAVTNSPTFLITSNSCGTTLSPENTCFITVQFFANLVGSPSSATLTVSTSAGPLRATVNATLVRGDVTLSPLDCTDISLQHFPCRVSMYDGPATVTLTNNLDTVLTIDSIATNPNTLFPILGGSCPLTGGTVPANGSCTIQVGFTGLFLTDATGTLTVIDNAPDKTPFYINLCHKPYTGCDMP